MKRPRHHITNQSHHFPPRRPQSHHFPSDAEDPEPSDTGDMVRGLLREIAGVTTLRTMSIAYFDTVTDDVIEALWRRDDDDDDDDDGGGR